MSQHPLPDEQLRNEVVHRHHGGQSERRIASQLGISRWRVKKILGEQARARDAAAGVSPPASLGSAPKARPSKLDAFEPHIARLLERYPRMTAVRIREELQTSGYTGGLSILAARVKELRVRPAKPLTVRFETGPGAQAQMDWSTYEIDFTQEGRRKVQAFSYVLGYSRRQYLFFTERQDFETTIRQHIEAFKHLGGVAATCLYDNMRVVVTHWEDDQPVYNTRFLAFATHYGYKPWACQVRRPQTKGKVERPFHYIETNLLNGRQFRSLEHLNESARWWLSEIADKRIHGTTKKTPLELHAEELPHLLPLPTLQFDTAQVVYRVVDCDGTIMYANNRYSVPWQLVAELLPVRVLQDELVVYNRSLSEVARHALLLGQSGQRRIAPEHLPPRDHEAQMEALRQRYADLGEVAVQFLDGLLGKQRNSKHQAQRVLGLLNIYPKSDVLAAMQRAVTYHAFGFSSLERILAHQGTAKPSWQQLSDGEREAIAKLTDAKPIRPRHSQEYQDLLSGKPSTSTTDPLEPSHEPQPSPPASHSIEIQANDHPSTQDPLDGPRANPPEPGDAEDQPGAGASGSTDS